MRGDEVSRLGVHPLDKAFEFTCLDPPLPTPTNLDRRQLTIAYQGIGLCGRDIQGLGDVGESQETHAAIVGLQGLSRHVTDDDCG